MSEPMTSVEERPPLDDVMLAMDVVDTLRRRERLVKKELDEVGREEDLKQRLREIYARQGIEVPDHVIEQGVTALKEDRFTYKPPKPSLATKLAYIYVKRSIWSKWVGGGLSAGLLAMGINHLVFVAPDAALPDELASTHAAVEKIAKTDNALSEGQKIFNVGEAALLSENNDGVKAAIARLADMQQTLEQEYTIQIVNRQGVRSGVWRIPDVNSKARNFYIIVEAVDGIGNRLSVPIKSEESGETKWVKIWGLRVDQAIFNSVANDKRDNGIIERDRFGYKPRGHLVPKYEMRTSGGAITQW